MIRRARTLLRVVTLTVVLGLLTACGGSSGGTTTGEGEVRTVVIWDRANAQATIKQQWFETWNATQGKELGVQVRYEPQAGDRYEEIVRVAFQTKRGPDLFHTPSAQLGAFVAAGWVQPLDGVVDAGVLETAAPYLGKNSELVWGGKPYAIPTTAFTNRLVINRDLFTKAGLDPAAPPRTLSELVAASEKLAAVSPGKVYGFGMPTKWVGFRQWMVDLPVMASRPDLTNGMFNQAGGRYDSAQYAEIVTAYRSMITDGSAYPGAATLDLDAMTAAFGKGEIGMMINSSNSVAVLATLGSTVDAAAVPLPTPDGQTLVRSPMNAGYPYGMSSTTAEPEAAAIALQALVGDGVQQALAEGGAPPLSDAVWDSEPVTSNALLSQFRPGETDQQWPKNPNAVVAVEGETLDQTIVGLVISDDQPIESTLTGLQERYQKAYEQGVANGEIDPAEFTR